MNILSGLLSGLVTVSMCVASVATAAEKSDKSDKSAKAAIPASLPAGYRLETIAIPAHITLGVGGLAFTPKGDLLICTREGEVWNYQKDRWTLFAKGLHEPLGLHVDPKNGDVWVMQRGELTKLVDENADGKVDLYQTVNADWGLSDNYHEYAFGLVRDADGNFYGTLNTSLSWQGWAKSDRWDIGRIHDSKMGRAAPYRGWCFQITPDGKFVPYASGLRSPAGIGMNKRGEIFYSDNQGDWNCTSSLHQVVKGRFYGHPSSLIDHPDYAGKNLNRITEAEFDRLRQRPALYLPQGELANSPGEPTFNETQGKFGPFEDQIFIGDQTKSNMMRAVLERVGGEYQGVVFNFASPLQCGVIRNRFASDGSLWIGQTGRGWRSVGGKMFGLECIRWDGKTIPLEMQTISLTKTGFRIQFTKPVNRDEASTPANYSLKHWGYLFQADYGSPKVGLTDVVPTAITVSDDGLSVDLTLPLVTERVYQVTLRNITGKDATPMVNVTGYYTLNRLRD